MHKARIVMASQDGLITRAQALDAGLSPTTIRHLLRTGVLVIVRRGVYADGELWRSLDPYRVSTGSGPGPRAPVLTNREREVLTLISDGLSNKEIACRLNVGVRTVETHRERIMRKLDIHSVAGLTRYAISSGLVSLDKQLTY